MCELQTSTDYGPYLANEPSPLHTTTVVDRCTEKLVDDWNKLRVNVSSSHRLIACISESKLMFLVHIPYHISTARFAYCSKVPESC